MRAGCVCCFVLRRIVRAAIGIVASIPRLTELGLPADQPIESRPAPPCKTHLKSNDANSIGGGYLWHIIY
jgi:hypothetical protein